MLTKLFIPYTYSKRIHFLVNLFLQTDLNFGNFPLVTLGIVLKSIRPKYFQSLNYHEAPQKDRKI